MTGIIRAAASKSPTANCLKRCIAASAPAEPATITQALLDDIETEVEDRGAVGNPAGGDQVDTGGGDLRSGVEGDPPGGFGDGPAVDHRHGPAQRFGCHVVEQYGVDA